jgi:hypothetical protein
MEKEIGERDIGERNIGDRDIGETDFGERDIRERDSWETVTTCRFNLQLLIYIHIPIHIQGVSGCLSFSQSWHGWARFLRHHASKRSSTQRG